MGVSRSCLLGWISGEQNTSCMYVGIVGESFFVRWLDSLYNDKTFTCLRVLIFIFVSKRLGAWLKISNSGRQAGLIREMLILYSLLLYNISSRRLSRSHQKMFKTTSTGEIFFKMFSTCVYLSVTQRPCCARAELQITSLRKKRARATGSGGEGELL